MKPNKTERPTGSEERFDKEESEALFEEGDIEERLQSERDDLFGFIYRVYCTRYGDVTVKDYVKTVQEIRENPQLQYEALRLFNRKLRLGYRIAQEQYREDLRLGELFGLIDKLAEAEDEETFNKIYHQIKRE